MSGKQMSAKDLAVKSFKNVELTLREVINSNGPLREFANQEMPVLVGYKIGRVVKALDTVTENFGNRRTAILDRLGKLNAETGSYEFENNNEKIAEDEITEILKETVTVNVPMITLKELEGKQMPPRILALLDWFIKED